MAHRRVNFGGVSRFSGRPISTHNRTSPNKSSMPPKKQDPNERDPVDHVSRDEEDPVVSTDDEDPMDVDQDDDQDAIDAQLAQEGRTKPGRDFTIKDEHLFMETDEGDDGKENNGKDEALFQGMEKLKREVIEFAKGVSPIPANRQERFVKGLLVPENEELIRYVGCLVMGGTATKWYDLLTTDESREAIVVGITARALKEHVFGDYLFGGDKSILDRLMKIDTGGKYHCGKKSKMIQWDPRLTLCSGFARTEERAKLVNGYEMDTFALDFRIASFQAQLAKLLTPFWSDQGAVDLSTGKRGDELTAIISLAAKMAELIRRTPDVVYYWPPTFKDEEFEPARMEASNLSQMIQSSPYDKKKVGGIQRAVLREGFEHQKEAIVRIVTFPGIVAYRQYGGRLAAAELAAEGNAEQGQPEDVLRARDRFGQAVTAKQGFRSRLIIKSVVYLEWGQQRLLTKEAGTSAHLDAVRDSNTSKYTDDSRSIKDLYTWYLEIDQLRRKAEEEGAQG